MGRDQPVELLDALARGTGNVEDIRKALRREGYSSVDAHLSGASIRAQLKRQFAG